MKSLSCADFEICVFFLAPPIGLSVRPVVVGGPILVPAVCWGVLAVRWSSVCRGRSKFGARGVLAVCWRCAGCVMLPVVCWRCARVCWRCVGRVFVPAVCPGVLVACGCLWCAGCVPGCAGGVLAVCWCPWCAGGVLAVCLRWCVGCARLCWRCAGCVLVVCWRRVLAVCWLGEFSIGLTMGCSKWLLVSKSEFQSLS